MPNTWARAETSLVQRKETKERAGKKCVERHGLGVGCKLISKNCGWAGMGAQGTKDWAAVSVVVLPNPPSLATLPTLRSLQG